MLHLITRSIRRARPSHASPTTAGRHPRSSHRRSVALAAVLAPLVMAGCVGGPPAASDADGFAKPDIPVAAWSGDPRELRAFDGRTGEPVAWPEVIARATAAEAIVLGEQHNDAAAHAAQAAIVGDVLAARPGGAVALEMLERDEQRLVDDWRDGIIDAEQLATLTASTDWAGTGSWEAWYQPVLDAAQAHGAGVVAANAPRRYVRLARTQGYDRLAALPAERRSLVTWPNALDTGDYRRRFAAFMSGQFVEGAMPPPSPDDAPEPPNVASIFRSQQAWDATMADSVTRALNTGTTPVLLLVGQFHSDFEGGTVLEIRRRRPGVRVLNISFQPRGAAGLAEADRGRADIIFDTGIDTGVATP
ncbi:MAG: ChaN family lipoprotein [Phycisphaerales bacterium]